MIVSAVNDQASDVVFAELAGAYWLDGVGWGCQGCRMLPASRKVWGHDSGRGLADRLARWRKVMMPLTVLTIVASVVVGALV
ncbi:hypothetical protein GCM10010330_80030 [Streptomyces tendae]|nr:hypothetical protein GCM10010330_80030 [Streptomyces tendae]